VLLYKQFLIPLGPTCRAGIGGEKPGGGPIGTPPIGGPNGGGSKLSWWCRKPCWL